MNKLLVACISFSAMTAILIGSYKATHQNNESPTACVSTQEQRVGANVNVYCTKWVSDE